MRAITCLLLIPICLQAQGRLDLKIQAEFQEVMALAAAPKDGSTLGEPAARARAESFSTSLKAFLARWDKSAAELTTGRYIHARALLVGGRPGDAIPVLQGFILDYPDSSDNEEALLGLGGAYLDSKQADLAVGVFEAFLRDRPKSERRHVASYYLGMAFYELGNIDGALALIKGVVDSGRTDSLVIDANVKYVELLRSAGRVEPAREHLAKLLAAASDAKYLLTLKEQLDTIGKVAPELTNATSWINGSADTLAAHKGQVVVLTFFQHWPEASQRELASMAVLHKELAGESVAFMGLTKFYEPFPKKPREAQVGDVTRVLVEQGVTYPVGITDDFATLRAYTVRGVPETVVIGRDGRIAYVKYGASRGNAKALRDLRLAILRAEK